MPIFEQILQPQPAGPSDGDLASRERVERWWRRRNVRLSVTATRRMPEIALLIAVAATLNFWDLSRNHWANLYYAAAVRSMSTSWHNFLYASFDPSGVMTIDKPPLAFWIQALSVRLFGYHSLSILIPDALIGVLTVVLLYDLVRRLFGRVAGVIAGLALATTPITVAMSRHNNPDALLALCCVAALWFFVRAVQDGRTRWLVLSGVMVGLGFETKMGVALVVVPGIVAAWLWLRPLGWKHAFDQLFAGGVAMLLVGGAWPLLVYLTPAVDRPWVAGTSDNSIISLIFGYNGFGRVAGQNGGPSAASAGGGVFAGATGPFRLLNAELGGQAGWLLGIALLAGIAILIATRLRRSDPRSGWIIAVGCSFLATAAVFSIAQGIFHPYYVSLLAPFTAALVGAGVGQLIAGKLGPPIVAALVLAAGVACELVVLADYPGQLTWVEPLLLAAGGLACFVLLATSDARARAVAISIALAALLVAPAIWAVDTLGYATQSTFPAGGPAIDNSAAISIGRTGGGRLGLFAGSPGRGSFAPPGSSVGSGAVPSLFANPSAGGNGGPGVLGGPGSGGFGFAGGSSGLNDRGLSRIVAFVKHHGGGTIAVSQQSNAAKAIILQHADIAGIGGFSGRESDPSLSWLAMEVSSGRIRWVYNQGLGNFGSAADGRLGDTAAIDAAAKVCKRVVTSRGAQPLRGPSFEFGVAAEGLYDCAGDGPALNALSA
jgi:4-amino-4-deoxy-L-arabinose transferase-like glycosyltransferase